MKLAVCLLVAVVGVGGASPAMGQVKSVEAQSSSKIVEWFNLALAKGEFIDKGKEYDWNQSVDLRAMAGTKDPVGSSGSEVEFQIGTKDGKPAFVTVVLPREREKLDDAVSHAILSGQIKLPKPNVLMCAPGFASVCVETGKDGKCTKYECAPPQH